jgi:hypothetical protein
LRGVFAGELFSAVVLRVVEAPLELGFEVDALSF